MADLNGKKIAFLATDMVEQVELTEPWKAIETLLEEFAKTPVGAGRS